MTDLTLSDLKLLRLTLDRIGPFQETEKVIDFFGVPEDPSVKSPANLYMLLAKNGHGKTTILEAIHGLFGLLGKPVAGRFARPGFHGRVQADMRATWTLNGETQTVLLSLWTGGPIPLKTWDNAAEREDFAQASEWATLGLEWNGANLVVYDQTNSLGFAFHQAVQEQIDQAPTGLFGVSGAMPTVLMFPADRTLVAPEPHRAIERPEIWGYQPARRFGSDGPSWPSSIDNLLVWLDWLDDKRLDRLIDYVNENLFQDLGKTLRKPQREQLAAYISTSSGEHGLPSLSHGERALLQIYVRLAAHMTRNTIVLIDEVETHLHPVWMQRLFKALKTLAAGNERLSIIFTTHSRELIRDFDHKLIEPKLTKGVYLIPDEVE